MLRLICAFVNDRIDKQRLLRQVCAYVQTRQPLLLAYIKCGCISTGALLRIRQNAFEYTFGPKIWDDSVTFLMDS